MVISKSREWCIYEEWLIQRELTKLKEKALSDKWKKERELLDNQENGE